jgi:hypothetical protein
MTPDLLTSTLRQTRLWDLDVPMGTNDEHAIATDPADDDRDAPTTARATQPMPDRQGAGESREKQERRPLALVPSQDEGNGMRRRARKRTQAVAARCVGALPLRPVDAEATAAIAAALVVGKRRQLRARLEPTAVSGRGYGRPAGRAQE